MRLLLPLVVVLFVLAPLPSAAADHDSGSDCIRTHPTQIPPVTVSLRCLPTDPSLLCNDTVCPTHLLCTETVCLTHP